MCINPQTWKVETHAKKRSLKSATKLSQPINHIHLNSSYYYKAWSVVYPSFSTYYPKASAQYHESRMAIIVDPKSSGGGDYFGGQEQCPSRDCFRRLLGGFWEQQRHSHCFEEQFQALWSWLRRWSSHGTVLQWSCPSRFHCWGFWH